MCKRWFKKFQKENDNKTIINNIVCEWLVGKGKNANKENVERIVSTLEKSLLLIEEKYKIKCYWENLDSLEQKRGRRVCLIYDKEHYFIMNEYGKVFAPHADRESALRTFNELENNEDIQLDEN